MPCTLSQTEEPVTPTSNAKQHHINTILATTIYASYLQNLHDALAILSALSAPIQKTNLRSVQKILATN